MRWLFRRKLVEQFARGGEIAAFEVDEPDDDVGNLNAGVVDVVLHADLVAGFVVVRAQQALKGVAENRVAQVADVRGLVWD